jgi:hypothetical protein
VPASPEGIEYGRVKARVDALMTGGPIGDGIGPGNACRQINEEFGTCYQPSEIWRIWRQGKPWADPADDLFE